MTRTLVLLLGLSACSDTTYADYAMQHCSAYGLQPGTAEFAQCAQNETRSMVLMEQRTPVIVRLATPPAPIKPAMVQCTPNYNGGVNCTER